MSVYGDVCVTLPPNNSGSGNSTNTDASAAFNRRLYWSDFVDSAQAGIYVYSLDDATKTRLLPNAQIRPRALAVDFVGKPTSSLLQGGPKT